VKCPVEIMSVNDQQQGEQPRNERSQIAHVPQRAIKQSPEMRKQRKWSCKDEYGCCSCGDRSGCSEEHACCQQTHCHTQDRDKEIRYRKACIAKNRNGKRVEQGKSGGKSDQPGRLNSLRDE